MRKILIALVPVLLAGAGTAHAQGGIIGLYKDTSGNDCDLVVSQGDPYFIVHVVHHVWEEAAGVVFSAPPPGCSGLQWLADAIDPPMIYIGSTRDGIWISYSGCRTGSVHVMDILTYSYSSPQGCCEWQVLYNAMEVEPWPFGYSCGENPEHLPAYGERSTITEDGNPVPNCFCYHSIPTEATTWGKVKAMYGE